MALRATCERLLGDRGHTIKQPPPDLLEFPHLLGSGGPQGPCLVAMHSHASIGVDTARAILQAAAAVDAQSLVVVASDATPSMSHVARQALCEGLGIVHVFSANSLQVPYVDSAYVPVHKRVSWDEIARQLKSIDVSHMPKISKDDPVCKWYGWVDGFIKVQQAFTGLSPFWTYERVV